MKTICGLQDCRIDARSLHLPHLTNSPHTVGRRRLALIATLALGWPLLGHADCESRKAQPAETAFHARAMAVLVAALPPVPAGVTELDAKPFDFKTVPAIGEVLCDFSKEGEFSITARRQYIRKHSEAERRHLQAQYDALTAQFHALKKTPPEKTAEQQTLRQQSNAAFQATRDAEKAGNKAAAEERNAQYRALRDQADAIDAQHQASVKPQTSELDQRRTAIDLEGQKVDIVLGMNLPRLPAARADNTSGAYGVASRGKSVGLQVHNVGITVRGTDGPLRQALAGAIDHARLQALVGKPLPSAAESEAYAAKAVPVSVAGLPASAMSGTPMSASSPSSPAPQAPPDPQATSQAASPTQTAAAQPTNANAPTGPEPVGEPLKKAAEAVNLLRGLLGR